MCIVAADDEFVHYATNFICHRARLCDREPPRGAAIIAALLDCQSLSLGA